MAEGMAAVPLQRWLLAGAALVAAGCVWGVATSPIWSPATDETGRWVVHSGSYNRYSDTHSVTCVPAGQAELDDWDRWRDVVVAPELAYAAETGDPCPAGPTRDSDDGDGDGGAR